MFERITDHVARALALLPEQFRRANNEALLTSWIEEFQAIEDALWAVLEATLDTATGARLDQFATLLGEPRLGLDDEPLRLVLRARIVANRSLGRDLDLAAMLAALEVTFTVEDFAPAGVLVTLDGFPGEGLPPRVGALVRRTLAAGVGGQTVSPASVGGTFRLSSDYDAVEVDADHGLADGGLVEGDPTTGGHLAGVYT